MYNRSYLYYKKYANCLTNILVKNVKAKGPAGVYSILPASTSSVEAKNLGIKKKKKSWHSDANSIKTLDKRFINLIITSCNTG